MEEIFYLFKIKKKIQMSNGIMVDAWLVVEF
jgi:hypothetical protein